MKDSKKIFLVTIALILVAVLSVIIAKSIIEKVDSDSLFFNKKISINDLKNDKGLIFSIKKYYTESKCAPSVLYVYENRNYEYYYAYYIPVGEGNVDDKLIYDTPLLGMYSLDVLEIFKDIKKSSARYYVITDGNGNEYYTDENNKALKEFLKSIDINLNKCMSEIQIPIEEYNAIIGG